MDLSPLIHAAGCEGNEASDLPTCPAICSCIQALSMLNLPVAMINALFSLFSILFLLVPPAQQVLIDSPLPGEVLQGQVSVTGSTAVEGFQSYEVAFAYQNDQTNTWFPIGGGKQPIAGGALTTWDTTTITDGTYKLRVNVYLSDGRVLEKVVSSLRVRNYTAVETSTPAPAATSSSLSPSAAPSGDFTPAAETPAAGDINSAQVTQANLGDSLMKGGLAALGLFILLGIYLGIRTLIRRG